MSQAKEVIGITGTPGTGKKTIGKALSLRLCWPMIEVNELAEKGGAIIGRDRFGFIADTKKLKRLLRSELGPKRKAIVVGHLIPYILPKGLPKLIVVLRCSPYELEARLSSRGYEREKVMENVQAEILDICLNDAIRKFGVKRLLQIDTTGAKPEDVADEIMASLKSGRVEVRKVDWLSELSSPEVIRRYFE